MSYQRPASRTLRATVPLTAASWPNAARGPRGMRPKDPFIPTSPQYEAGMRMLPPPSPPVAAGTRPPATADAEPPEEPAGVRSRVPGVWGTPGGFGGGVGAKPKSEGGGLATRTTPPG